MEFFESFHSDNATYPLDKFYISEQAKNVAVTSWKEPTKPEDKTYEGKSVHKMRTIEAEFKVDSTFVKSAPTIKTYRIIEWSATYIRIVCLNRTRDIPYCDTFDVEEV